MDNTLEECEIDIKIYLALNDLNRVEYTIRLIERGHNLYGLMWNDHKRNMKKFYGRCCTLNNPLGL